MIRNLLLHNQKKLGGKTVTAHLRTRRKKQTNRSRLNPSSMAFWGALVRTDEPLSVVLDGGPHRRLRISQAVLGGSRGCKTERSQSRNRLYCKVRENPRVLLCVFRFKGTEMCSLDLEFTAPDNVVFSVVGVRDIHISGYYFIEFRLPYAIRPQNQIAPPSNREEVETSGDTFVLECPPGQGNGSQIEGQGAPMQHVEETGIDAPRAAEESALHFGGDQHFNVVEENRSPSIGTFMSVAEDSGESLLGTRVPHHPLVSGDSHNEIQNRETTAEVTEKYGEIDGKNVEAIINRIVAEVEMGLEAESIGYNENPMTMHVGHAEKPERPPGESALHNGADQHINLVEEIRGPSINKCLGIVTRASQQSLMNIVATGQRQAILGSSWNDMQNLPELLMRFLTKVPYKVDWTSIALSSRGKDVQETLHMLNPMTGCFTHGVKSTRLGEKCTSDDEVNCFSNFVQGDSRVSNFANVSCIMCMLIAKHKYTSEQYSSKDVGKPGMTDNGKLRHVEKITLCELEQPGNAIVENYRERIGEGELTEPDESLNNVDHLRGNSERDDSQLVDEDRLKSERKKRETGTNSISVGLNSIRKEASEPNQQSGAVEPRKVEDRPKERSYIKKDKAAKWIFKRRGVDEENLQLQTDKCETTMVDCHFDEQQQLKAKKKRKPETICNQDLRSQMSQSDDRDSTRHITNELEKNKLRSGIGVHEEKLEKCDAPDAGEKNRTTEQVMVLAANTKQEHGRCVSVKPAATQLTSTGIENSWTIVAALPAVGNPHINFVDPEETFEMPSDLHDCGEINKKKKMKGKKKDGKHGRFGC
ncbi:hypothetical protein Cgig2_027453 [Carnegiea gigantea]|uniref:Nucleoplasmin-like domain-containing protein n=1 Tax=Carnegiea gigantea TaxID=171969 RepID=A0A9Q1QM07_9CARY|nr:hypothetical protein Cgig2_027453 [Carnegiea gigantea]